ncbi:hypothetical protein CK227_10520 [Mesorhizobium sp. WSM4308]|uniref:hypothetical protein n=1 Tax=Mesorhizobium sp. WSM4308 TaxID=2029409 RepID=UPI000BAE7DD6|nr:hypothetical protein [Mesorhizobium sp. WSM4308]PBB75217.1 hypothetical protein CK227_10520 [Mesorhizobium sp. WSM4308]
MDLKTGDTRLIIDACKADGLQRSQAAYVLATAYHETAHTVKPIYERGAKAYFNKYKPGTKIGKALGNSVKGDGYLFRGRGYVQLTGRANYARAGKELAIDLLRQPDLALLSANAAQIIVLGMVEGWFTGKKLSDYINSAKSDFANARRVINGTDKADLIAGYAKQYDTLLIADGYGIAAPQEATPAPVQPAPVPPEPEAPAAAPVAPQPAQREPQPLPPPASKKPAAAGIVILIGAAIAGFWHHIVNAFWSIF